MHTVLPRFRAFVTPVLIASLMGFGGCGEDAAGPDASDAPEIPPLSTFLIDFSSFADAGASRPAEAVTSVNWGHAAFTALVWNTLITVGLAVPVAAFAESFNHVPLQTADGSWLWSYSVTAGSQVYTAKLYGSLVAAGTHWEMFITKHGVYDDFLWYTGDADLTLTEGSWMLNRSPEQPHPLLEIAWHRDPQEGTADIRYSNVESGNPEQGGYILYGTTVFDQYDGFYDVYNKGQDNHTDAEWDFENGDGRVRDPRHFGDNDWHCWDEDQQDVICP